MDRLGYTRWAAQGGDWGSMVTETIARKAPPGLLGVHMNFPLVFPTADETANATAHEKAMMASAKYYQDVLSGYAKEMSTRPQTIGYALSDSPAGLAAWIYAMFQDVSDSGGNPETVFDMDTMLDDIMLYWLPNAAASAARLYWEAEQQGKSAPPPSGPNPTPAGFSIFPKELVRASRRWLERRYETILHFKELDAGGHFAAMEQPAAFTDEIRATFRSLR